jgi:hypothetical protein
MDYRKWSDIKHYHKKDFEVKKWWRAHRAKNFIALFWIIYFTGSAFQILGIVWNEYILAVSFVFAVFFMLKDR